MIIILSITGLLLVLETIILVNQFRREQRLEEIVNQALGKLDLLRAILKESGSVLNENPRLKEAFAHDDEVGDYFKKIVEVQKTLEEPFEESSENEEEYLFQSRN